MDLPRGVHEHLHVAENSNPMWAPYLLYAQLHEQSVRSVMSANSTYIPTCKVVKYDGGGRCCASQCLGLASSPSFTSPCGLLIATVSGPASIELSLPQRSLARLLQYLTDKESP
jgi:hypothetical protein